MGRRIVVGDLHGAHLAFIQCLERSKFDYEHDQLILIGDIVDGWSYVYELVEEILKITNLIAIKGNHDQWFIDFLQDNYSSHPTMWTQGGEGTLTSYIRYSGHSMQIVRGVDFYTRKEKIIKIDTDFINTSVPQSHRDFFMNMQLYWKDINNNLFVHGGFDRYQLLDYLKVFNPSDFYWNRTLWKQALSFHNYENSKFKIEENVNQIFIGHSETLAWNTDQPMHAANKIWNIDTGAGFKGKLTFMNVDTFEYWQSDDVQELYANEINTG